MPLIANAQSFDNTTPGDIDNTVSCGTANLTRTISVSGVGTVTDVNFGLLATHTWRGDIRLDLTSPAPGAVTVRLINSDTSGSGNDDDYNVELTDELANPVINTGAVDGPHNTSVSPFQFIARPNNALSTFNGANADGDWTITICDDFNGDNGEFLQGTLNFTNPTDADVSLTASVNDPTPDIGDTVILTMSATNSGPATATGLTAQISLPTGLSFISSGGTGTYDNSTGVWTLPASLAPGGTDLTIQATVLATGSVTTTAEISTANETDPDSTPGNSVTTEDDYDTVSFTPQIGPNGPGLSCPIANQFEIDWTAPGGTFGWDAGELTNTYSIGGDDYVLTMTGATNRFITRTYNGSSPLTPVTTDQFEGGNTNGDFGVVMNADFANTSETITVTMSLGDVGVGVEEVTFGIFDVDNGAWIDEITITGTLSGTAVTPTLFEGGTSVSVSGNEGLGVDGSASASGDGNLFVRFENPVDTVAFVYANASTTADPASQVISLQPITMCPRLLADLTAVKTVEVYDPAALGLYMTPGNEVLYKITVTNSASATAAAEDVDISDTLPANLKFVSATTTGFTGGAFGTPDLPAANTDCGATACVVRFSGGDVPIDTTAEISVRAQIK